MTQSSKLSSFGPIWLCQGMFQCAPKSQNGSHSSMLLFCVNKSFHRLSPVFRGGPPEARDPCWSLLRAGLVQEGCQFVRHDFVTEEKKIDPSFGAGTVAWKKKQFRSM